MIYPTATKKLAFKVEVAKGLPYDLGDEQRLTQVLLNLVGNAIKFTDAGEVRIAAGAANGYFAVSVSDTGPGIPPEECDRIFEKFRQVDSSNTRTKGGVLMDIQLPILDGYDATRQIKALPGFAAIPIIAVSSFAMKGDEERARASGCDEHVTKPYSPVDLLRLVRRSRCLRRLQVGAAAPRASRRSARSFEAALRLARQS